MVFVVRFGDGFNSGSFQKASIFRMCLRGSPYSLPISPIFPYSADDSDDLRVPENRTSTYPSRTSKNCS